MRAVSKSPVWVFEWMDWCSTESHIEAPVTFNRVFAAAKKAKFALGCDKKHYRLVELPNEEYDFQTELDGFTHTPKPGEWHSVQILKKKK